MGEPQGLGSESTGMESQAATAGGPGASWCGLSHKVPSPIWALLSPLGSEGPSDAEAPGRLAESLEGLPQLLQVGVLGGRPLTWEGPREA